MYYLQVQIVMLLYGISHVYGFSRSRHEDFLFDQSESFNKTIIRSDHPTFWIEQPVDHFNKSDQRTWKQKYYKLINSWKPGGPILLYINGESTLELTDLWETYLNDYGGGESQASIGQIVEETGAAYFMLEHRYYGSTSQPFDEATTENLAFLTSRQALADAAHLLLTIKGNAEFKNSKVIVVGCSYAGTLAAWMKLLYPSLVDAVLSSSAAVLAKKDFNECFEVTTDTYRTYGSQVCVNEIAERFNNFHVMLQSPEGIKTLKEKYLICEDVDMTVPENQQMFFDKMITDYGEGAQYGTPKTIPSICEDLNDYEMCHNRSSVWNNETHCNDYDYYKTIKQVHIGYHRSWLYQMCTEFGYFQSTSSSNQMFGNTLPIDFYYKSCRVIFGEEFNEERVEQGVINTNNMYKGLNPNVENVVFVNGDMDPWHSLGILHDLSANAPAIYLKGSSHCHDLYPNPTDSDSIKEARKRIKNLLKKLIGAA